VEGEGTGRESKGRGGDREKRGALPLFCSSPDSPIYPKKVYPNG